MNSLNNNSNSAQLSLQQLSILNGEAQEKTNQSDVKQAQESGFINADTPISGITSFSSVESEEPDNDIKKRMMLITKHFNKLIETLVKKNGMTFPTYVEILSSRKAAQGLLNNSEPSEATTALMRKIIESDNQILDSFSATKIIEEIYRELTDKTYARNNRQPLVSSNMRRLINSEMDYKAGGAAPKYNWGAIRKRIWDAQTELESNEARNHSLKNKNVTWITGSNSSSIPTILKASALIPSIPKPSLVPTGMLLAHNIVPFSGELAYGIGEGESFGVNLKNLSGMNISNLDKCMKYATDSDYKFDANRELSIIANTTLKNPWSMNRLKIAVMRLLLMGAKKEQYPQIIKTIKALRESIAESNNKLDSQQEEYFKTVMDKKSACEKLDAIINLFTEVQPLNFSTAEIDLINAGFPIIWASNSLTPIKLGGRGFGMLAGDDTEYLVTAAAELGNDIQAVFTDKLNINTLKPHLESLGVAVLSFDAAQLLIANLPPEERHIIQEDDGCIIS